MVGKVFESSFQNIKRIKNPSFVEGVMAILVEMCQAVKQGGAVDWRPDAVDWSMQISSRILCKHISVDWMKGQSTEATWKAITASF